MRRSTWTSGVSGLVSHARLAAIPVWRAELIGTLQLSRACCSAVVVYRLGDLNDVVPPERDRGGSGPAGSEAQ